jgi:hypothetical protein
VSQALDFRPGHDFVHEMQAAVSSSMRMIVEPAVAAHHELAVDTTSRNQVPRASTTSGKYGVSERSCP